MAILQYPGLDQVENEGTKAALRLIWDEIRSLDDREEVSEGLTATELDQVQTALQLGGSNQLSVNGLLGKLQGVQTSKVQQHAMWRSTVTTAGAGYFVFNSESFNTAPGMFRWNAARTNLHFLVSGTYLVLMYFIVYGHASGVSVSTLINSTVAGTNYVVNICRDDSSTNPAVLYSGNNIDLVQLQAGDYMTWHSLHGTRFGWAGGTQLRVIRLV